MNEEKRHTLYAAVLRLLRPLIRILLRNGVPFGAFADLARWTYVDLAIREFGIEGRKPSDSRASIVTGLSRKEVSRLKKMDMPWDTALVERYNRAARVLGGWGRDPRFADAGGRPRDLLFDQGEGNFCDLVKEHSGDVPARAILDELLLVGAVETLDGGHIRLVERAYIPRTGELEKLGILGVDVADLIQTIDHNLSRGDSSPRYQRKVMYDNVPAEAVEKFRQLGARQGQMLLELLDLWLSEHDRDRNPELKGEGRKRVGVGIYYFEEDFEDTTQVSAKKGGRK